LSEFNKPRIFSTDKKKSNTKFHENLSSVSRIVPRRRTDRHTWRTQQSIFAISRTRLDFGYFLLLTRHKYTHTHTHTIVRDSERYSSCTEQVWLMSSAALFLAS
jgi:hypothetical protein